MSTGLSSGFSSSSGWLLVGEGEKGDRSERREKG